MVVTLLQYLQAADDDGVIGRYCGNQRLYPMDAPRINEWMFSVRNIMNIHFHIIQGQITHCIAFIIMLLISDKGVSNRNGVNIYRKFQLLQRLSRKCRTWLRRLNVL